ncbi:TPA: hypothetical protein QIW77_003095 [Klebsiella pneumoniae]|nr:hypothetical protein [Klebsiella pneumoniae]
MTDITELAQRMKAAAVRAKTATEEYASGHMSISVCYAECEEFNRLTDGPDNIIALVEALEKAQHRIAELEEAEQKLCAANVTLDARAELAERRLAEMESRTVTAAAADVLAERQRQVTAEGWSPKHDDQYKNTELAFAASCYSFHAAAASWDLEDNGIPYDSHPVPKQWPWDPSWWRLSDGYRNRNSSKAACR